MSRKRSTVPKRRAMARALIPSAGSPSASPRAVPRSVPSSRSGSAGGVGTRRSSPLLLFVLHADLQGAEELAVERRHLERDGLALLHLEVEGRHFGGLAAARLVEADG